MVVEVVSVIVTIILTLIGIAAFNRVIAVHDFLGAVLVVALILLGVNLTNKFPDTVRVHINALNAKNPLYTKGYFRKNASEKGVFSNITILLIIQILAILTIAFTLLYFGVSVIGISNRNPVLEKILFFSIGLLTGLKFMVTVYFELRYDRYFVYFEDKNQTLHLQQPLILLLFTLFQ